MVIAEFKTWEEEVIEVKEFKTRKEAYEYADEKDYLVIELTFSTTHMGFVNVYEVTREYGGPEEGGWYYNSLRCIESIPCRAVNSDEIITWAKNEYKHIKSGNIYSVLGGSELEILWEEKPSESETRRKPHWDGEY